MPALVLCCINQYKKFEVHSFINYKDMTGSIILKNRSRDSSHMVVAQLKWFTSPDYAPFRDSLPSMG